MKLPTQPTRLFQKERRDNAGKDANEEPNYVLAIVIQYAESLKRTNLIEINQLKCVYEFYCCLIVTIE